MGYPHQSPYDYGQDIVTDVSTGRTYGSQAELMRQREREADNDAYMQMIRAAGGRSGGGGGMPSGSGVGGGGGLAQSYADAYAGARGANESRYNDILGGFDQLMGGGKSVKKISSRGPMSRSMPQSKFSQYRDSGSPLGYFEWLRLRQQGERQALQSGGQFGSMDASRLYPREWGEGQFLGSPSQAGGQSAKPERPTVAPPVYPTYTPPTRGPQNY